jgi:nitroreductase/NAD-dependent dihydropyrimidine dehydrogenase PreA subunit
MISGNPRNIKIDPQKCLKDGLCIAACPAKIMSATSNGIPEVNTRIANACINCGHCVAICPANAISVENISGETCSPVASSLPEFESLNELIKARRSIRNFKDELINPAILSEIIQATKYAPTAKNSQMLSYILVSGKKRVHELSKTVINAFRNDPGMAPVIQGFESGYDVVHRGAPHVIVALTPKAYKWATMDGAIALSYLDLLAVSKGIGTCWAGFTTYGSILSQEVANSIGVPDSHKIAGAMMLGLPSLSYKKIPNRNEINLTVVS